MLKTIYPLEKKNTKLLSGEAMETTGTLLLTTDTFVNQYNLQLILDMYLTLIGTYSSCHS